MQPAAPAAILETALYATDLEAAAGFYGDLIGLTEVGRVPGRHIFYRVGPGILLIFNPEATEIPSAGLPVPTHGARGQGHVCFAATRAEIALWRAAFAAAGVAIDAEFDWPGGARSLYIRDPAGNSVEFAESWLWDDTPPP